MPPALMVIGAVVSVAGTAKSLAAQRKASNAAQKQQELQVARQRRQGIREAILKRSQAQASAQGLGAGSSSGAFGGIGAIGSQLGSNLGYGTQQTALSRIQTVQGQKAATWGAVADIGMTAFNFGASMEPKTPEAVQE